MKPFLMGAEVEYSMTGRINNKNMFREDVHDAIVDALRAEHAWLPDARGFDGSYLDTGARYYLDQGSHNEWASPELETPHDIALYDRAGERMVMRARDRAIAAKKSLEIRITKNNVNALDPGLSSWGQHEAYTCWVSLDEAAPMLIPHLVSRLPYAGAGCLSAHPSGIGFELSQRAQHMNCATGTSTTSNRAIFCTRAYKASDHSESGWTRVNLISKDSQRASFGMYLTYGITGLLFLLINEGHEIGRALRLESPVTAMRTISLDPWLKVRVPLQDGRSLTALEIQRSYLDEAEPLIRNGDFPDWTRQITAQAYQTFDQLAQDAMQLSGKLDAYLKLRIIDHQLARAGYSWSDLRRSLHILEAMRRVAPEAIVNSVINEQRKPPTGKERILYDSLLAMIDTQSMSLDHLRFATRMQALEQNYHELGGLFDQLDRQGQIESFLDADAVEHAIHHPPSGGRAEARSRCIQQFSGQSDWSADWQGVLNYETNRWYDMRDPFSTLQQYQLSEFDDEVLDAVAHFDRDFLGDRLSQSESVNVSSIYDRGDYEDLGNILPDQLEGVHRQTALRTMAWVRARRGFTDGAEYLDQLDADHQTPPIDLITNYVYVYRFGGGLVPDPKILPWLNRGQAWMAGHGISNATDTFCEHLGAFQLSENQLDDARDTLEGVCNWLGDSVRPRCAGRAHAALAEVYRRLGNIRQAKLLQVQAERIFNGQDRRSDNAEFALPVAAKLQRRRVDTIEILERALAQQSEVGHAVGEARSLALLARVSRDEHRNHHIQRRLQELQQQRPALAQCPKLNHVLDHWTQWTTDSSPDDSSDKYWGI